MRAIKKLVPLFLLALLYNLAFGQELVPLASSHLRFEMDHSLAPSVSDQDGWRDVSTDQILTKAPGQPKDQRRLSAER